MNGLNPAQDRAAAHGKGPMLLLAGPGTGKTATLATRVARLVETGVPETSILAITFTQAAALELRDRISRSCGRTETGVEVGTFHRICGLIARSAPREVPRLARKRLADDRETSRLATDCARQEARRPDGVVLDEQDAPMRIPGFKDLLLTPAQAMALAKTPQDAAWARAYQAYQGLLDSQGLYDFGDMIFGVVEALRTNRSLRTKIQRHWTYVLVDEYQDINTAQDALIGLLLGDEQNLWAVGDDDQALYGWRQADVRLLLEFPKRYPGAQVLRLTENYRCPPVVLSAANRLIRGNRSRYPKELRPTRVENCPITLHVAKTADSEAHWIAQRIQLLIQDGVVPSNIAVISRASSALGPTERALSKAGVPCLLKGAVPFWSSPAARVGLGLISRLVAQWPGEDLSAPPAWMQKRLEAALRSRQYPAVWRMVCKFVEDNPPKQGNVERRAAWRFAAQQLAEECAAAESVEGLMVRLQQQRGPSGPAVQLSTIHASKGLEWPEVFVCGLDAGLMPSQQAEDLEEERRIAYVAITRASHRLYLSRSIERQKKEHAPSPYLSEMLGAIPFGLVINADGQPLRLRAGNS